MVLELSLRLSERVDDELVGPMSSWLAPKETSSRFSQAESIEYDWAAYKRHQRMRFKKRRILAMERLKRFREKLGTLRSPKQCAQAPAASEPINHHQSGEMSTQIFADLLSPYSPTGISREQALKRFARARSASLSDLLPWKIILRGELSDSIEIRFSGLRFYDRKNRKQEIVGKLFCLLDLERAGELELVQAAPFESIRIRTKNMEANTGDDIAVTDQNGAHYQFQWLNLNEKQREKLVQDATHHKIICRSIEKK